MQINDPSMIALRTILLTAITCALVAGMAPALAADKITMRWPLSAELRAIARDYFLHDPSWGFKDHPEYADAIDNLAGAAFDIDGDGRNEVFIHGQIGLGICGSAVGCEVMVLKNDGEHWHIMGAFYERTETFTILERKDNGVRRIVAHQLTDEAEVTYKWDPSIRNEIDPVRLGDFVETDDN